MTEKPEPRSAEAHSKPFVRTKKFLIPAWISIVIVAGLVFLSLFRPANPYEIERVGSLDLESEDFARQLAILAAAPLYQECSVDVLTNGDAFYPAEIEAIRGAKKSVRLEAYIFTDGEVARQYRDALTDRARNGVDVRVVLDAIGSMSIMPSYFKDLTDAGGEVAFYHPTRWYTWDRINNRTHRELLVVDGTTGFVGGAGVADHWFKAEGDKPAWKDTMFRVHGKIVESMESVFVENWAEAAGQILTPELPDFAPLAGPATGPAIVVGSTPSAGGSTRARIIFQTMVASAKRSILINNPYFLPDGSMRDELVRAAQRGVAISVIVPGSAIDWELTRSASRQHYGELLNGGVTISEFQPTMIHRKTMVIDGIWSVVGSTNFDHRSFGLNDEINLVVRSPELADRIARDFRHDLEQSRKMTYEQWTHRSIWQRIQEISSSLIERQQ